MSRPKSMSDFSALLDPSAQLPSREYQHPRKKPSISLAAGLIMNSESPKSALMPPPLEKGVQRGGGREEWSENLFYAYAQKSDYAQSPPYILTFANASVCDQWWSLVQKEYPDSKRIGPQLFVLKGDDMQEQIQDNPKFFELRNYWFYTPGDGVIPIQDYKGHPVNNAPPPKPSPEEKAEKKKDSFDMSALSAALDKMNSMISENSAQIRALSVAQSEGLQRMQEINESNSTQIKALADSQSKLQGVVDQNASHYIALSNSSFANNEQIRSVLQSTASQIKALADSQSRLQGVVDQNASHYIALTNSSFANNEIRSVLQSTASQTKALADGQIQLSKTSEGMMRTIETLGHTVSQVSDSMENMSMWRGGSVTSDAESWRSSVSGSSGPPVPRSIASRISPPPRKLNRRIKGVWYEYDASPMPVQSPKKSVGVSNTRAPATPPKSPLAGKVK